MLAIAMYQAEKRDGDIGRMRVYTCFNEPLREFLQSLVSISLRRIVEQDAVARLVGLAIADVGHHALT